MLKRGELISRVHQSDSPEKSDHGYSTDHEHVHSIYFCSIAEIG
jgi:hypothetical protein